MIRIRNGIGISVIGLLALLSLNAFADCTPSTMKGTCIDGIETDITFNCDGSSYQMRSECSDTDSVAPPVAPAPKEF